MEEFQPYFVLYNYCYLFYVFCEGYANGFGGTFDANEVTVIAGQEHNHFNVNHINGCEYCPPVGTGPELGDPGRYSNTLSISIANFTMNHKDSIQNNYNEYH